MEFLEYRKIKQYLTNQFKTTNQKEQNRIQSKSKFFEIKNNLLYKVDRRRKTRGQLLKVLQKHEVEPVFFMMHNHSLGGHLGVDIVFNKI